MDLQNNPETDWIYHVEKSKQYGLGMTNSIFWPRGKMLGGCSATNAMLYVRGNRRDYNQWKDFGNDGWGWDDVLKYFKKSEGNTMIKNFDNKYHSADGPLQLSLFNGDDELVQTLLDAATELNIPQVNDINGDVHIGYNLALGNVKNGERWSSARSFLKPIRDRPNFYVIKHAHATKLNINRENKVESININLYNKEYTIKAKNEIILSAGSINTPQIMMLSGIGPIDHLKKLKIDVKKNLKVGRNLEDHIYVPFIIGLHKSHSKVDINKKYIENMSKYIIHHNGPFSYISTSELIAFLNTKNSSELFPDLQFHHVHIYQEEALKWFKLQGIKSDILKEIENITNNEELMLVLITLLNPKSKGYLQLNSKNPLDKPKIYPNYFDRSDDIQTLIRGIRHMQKMVNTESFKKHEGHGIVLNIKTCEEHKKDSDKYWECYIRHMSTTLYHPSGTAKMGPNSDKNAVVDSRLKVYGINGLRVADASIMPKIVSGNTNAPAIMIGEKASDLIKEDWGYMNVNF